MTEIISTKEGLSTRPGALPVEAMYFSTRNHMFFHNGQKKKSKAVVWVLLVLNLQKKIIVKILQKRVTLQKGAKLQLFFYIN